MFEQSETATVRSSFADDPDFGELLEMFFESMPAKRESIQQAFQSDDIDDLKSQAHQLKGAGGGYGFDDLTELAAEVEQRCKDNDSEGIIESLQKLFDYMDRMTM